MSSREDIYRIALQSLSDTVVVTDEKGAFKFICPNISTIFGYSADEVSAMPGIHALARDLRIDAKALELKGELCNIETTIHDKRGQEHVLLVNVKRVTVSGGTRLFSFRDISERKHAEIEAQQALAAKEKLLAVIAHDLRNPLHALVGYSDLLLDERHENLEESSREIMTTIALCAKRMQGLFENLLLWSDVQSEKARCCPVKCDLHDVSLAEVELLKLSAKKKNVHVSVNIPETTFALADPTMAALIFRNLISNAIKFSHPGGEIVIDSRDLGSLFEVTVADEGVGIELGESDKLFLGAGHTTHGTQSERGSGLGLMLCKEFVELNGGKIRAESRECEGSRFIFSLPKWRE